MNEITPNTHGLFDAPVRTSEREIITLTQADIERQLDAGATFIFTLPQFDATKHGVDKGNIVKDKGGSV